MDNTKNIESIQQMSRDKNWALVKDLLADMHPADIAEALSRLDEDLMFKVFSLLGADEQPLVIAELEENLNINILEQFDSKKISDIMDSMHPDDAADILQHFPRKRSHEILELMEKDESEDVRELMQYGEETAGGIMTTDFVSLPSHLTVDDALNLIGQLEEDEPFYYAYVVDSHDVMIGSVALWELVKTRNKELHLVDLVEPNFVSATVDMDQEECARIMSKYDLSSLPVTDEQGHLVGRIMIDDVIDVIEDEASEDILRLAGTTEDELLHSSPFRSAKLRLPWLLVTLAAGFVMSLLMKRFIDLKEAVILGAFVPIMMDMAGNTGVQSSTLVVRRIAMGSLDMSGIAKVLRKEIATGAIMGVLCGIAIAAWVLLIFRLGETAATFSPMIIAAIVALSLFAAMSTASLLGTFTPMVFEYLKIDPAIASGPLVTSMVDILALIIYYAIAVWFIAIFV